jgi:hypothetical protein
MLIPDESRLLALISKSNVLQTSRLAVELGVSLSTATRYLRQLGAARVGHLRVVDPGIVRLVMLRRVAKASAHPKQGSYHRGQEGQEGRSRGGGEARGTGPRTSDSIKTKGKEGDENGSY